MTKERRRIGLVFSVGAADGRTVGTAPPAAAPAHRGSGRRAGARRAKSPARRRRPRSLESPVSMTARGTAMSMSDRDGKIWIDGELVDWRDAKIHVLTHTLHYGCGAFE